MVVCLCMLPFTIIWDHYYLFMILPLYSSLEALEVSWTKRMLIAYGIVFALVDAPVLWMLEKYLAPRIVQNTLPSVPLLGCFALLGFLMVHYRELPERVNGDVD